MKNRAVLMGVALFVLIVGGMFAFAFLRSSEIAEAPADVTAADETDPSAQNTDERYSGIERITAKHFYIDGTHTLAGEIPMPTPCDLLDPSVAIAESMPEQVSVDFAVINNAETCAQVITPARFMVEAQASEEASFSASLAGRAIEFNLVPAEEGETPEDFELFIKG
ncbi:hypothetical protein N9L26_00185 [Candidatus Pacebacteria bacterium]|nr:hypothetical protein [Candidatus Paceibacterota bacterium]